MAFHDVCNGDADGLFALRQLRLDNPVESILVTGIKRDIGLLERVRARDGDHVTVLDVAIGPNHDALVQLLDTGATVTWYDHHAPGAIPDHPRLKAHIDTDADTCTSLLVDAKLNGRFRAWAVAAAYGDNLPRSAERLAAMLSLSTEQRAELRLLGEAVNYNAYGDTESDVRIHPAALYRWMAHYKDPFDLIARSPIIHELDELRRNDLARARTETARLEDARFTMVMLPDAPWSRRVIGTFANELATSDPQRASAVLKELPDGDYTASLRAPVATPRGADALAREFGGGGRAAAAGIERLPMADVPRFVARLATAKWAANDEIGV
jgi:hypothetical protein